MTNSAFKEREGKWAELTFSKTSGVVTWDRGKTDQ